MKNSQNLTVMMVASHTYPSKTSFLMSLSQVSMIFIIDDWLNMFVENYKPGGSYAVFAGKDCSVALGKMAFNEEYMNCYQTTKLSSSEYDSMIGWYYFMKKKYPIVGRVKEDKKDK